MGVFCPHFSYLPVNTKDRPMDVLDQKTDKELVKTLLEEAAKAANEIRCARGDIEKAQRRLGFITVLVHRLLERQGD